MERSTEALPAADSRQWSRSVRDCVGDGWGLSAKGGEWMRLWSTLTGDGERADMLLGGGIWSWRGADGGGLSWGCGAALLRSCCVAVTDVLVSGRQDGDGDDDGDCFWMGMFYFCISHSSRESGGRWARDGEEERKAGSSQSGSGSEGDGESATPTKPEGCGRADRRKIVPKHAQNESEMPQTAQSKPAEAKLETGICLPGRGWPENSG